MQFSHITSLKFTRIKFDGNLIFYSSNTNKDSIMTTDSPIHVSPNKNVEQNVPEQREQDTIQSPFITPALARQTKINPLSLTPSDVLRLQRTVGNRAVMRMLNKSSVSI